jgi:hypothetical protein
VNEKNITNTEKMKRAVKILLKLISLLLFSFVFSQILYILSRDQFTQVLMADWCGVKFPDEPEWILGSGRHRYYPSFWRDLAAHLYFRFPALLITSLCTVFCFWLIKKTPLSKYKICSWVIALVLTIPAVYFVFFSYATIREKVLFSRFSLELNKTIVILEHRCWLGGPSEPHRILYYGPSELDFSSVTNHLICYRDPEDRQGYDICGLSAKEMGDVLGLIKTNQFFSLGEIHGAWPWQIMDGSQLFITILEGDNKTTASCRSPGGRGEVVWRMYKDVSSVKPWVDDFRQNNNKE